MKFTVDELKKWYEETRKNVRIPVIAACDAIADTASELSNYPKGLAIGASSDPDAAFKLGQCIAREMSCCGIDWIWSPVADYCNRRHCFITRQFSNIPDDLIKCAIGYMKGLQSINVAATVKHFPGADKYDMRDSHIVTTNIGMTLEEWWEEQGRIFQEVIDAGVDAVMTEASAFPAVDDTCINGRFIPAGLSHRVITELLKEKMGFQGVVITDCVRMGGFTSFYSGGKLYAEFLNAGNDMLLGVGVDAVDLIEEEIKKGTLTEERIDDAVERVLRLKKKLGLFDKGYREPDWTIDEAVGFTSKMTRELAESSLTLIRDRKHTLPFQKENVKKVCIVCYTHNEKIYEELAAMREEFEAHGACVTMKRRLNSVEEAKEVANNHDLIVYVGHISFHSPHGPSSFYGVEYYALRHAFVYGVDKSIGVSLGYPHIHYDFMDDAIMFVNAYNASEETQKAFVKGVYGEIPFAGKSPVILDGVDSSFVQTMQLKEYEGESDI